MRIVYHATVAAMMTWSMLGCSEGALQKLASKTDVDLIDTDVHVSFLDVKKLDQILYNITTDEKNESKFLKILQTASGGDCLKILSVHGCHYISRFGHDVFISRVGPYSYRVFTSG